MKNTLNTLSKDRRPLVKENSLGTTGIYKGEIDRSLPMSSVFDVYHMLWKLEMAHRIIFDASHSPKVTQYKQEAHGYAEPLQGLIGRSGSFSMLKCQLRMLLLFIDRLSVVNITNRGCAKFGTVSRALPSLRDVFIELIDLLKGQPLSLIDHGVYEHKCDPAETTPDPEHVGLGWIESSSEVWRNIG